jgi:signal transduction histidine kinase
VIQALQEKRTRAEKRQAEERIQSEAQIALALARVGQGLIASLDTPTILDRLCHLVSEVLQCESSHTLLWRPQDNAFVSVACWGSTPEQWEALRLLRASREDFTDILIRLENEDVIWQQTEGAKDLFSRGFLHQLGVTDCLWMALRRGGEVIGFQTATYRAGEPCLRPRRERIGRGVTQLASLALDNARLLEQAERANRIKSDFLSMMSHELRTPLHVIMGYNSLLLEDQFDPVTPAQTDILLRMERNANQLLGLITATLDMSRLEAGRVPLTLEAVEVSQYVRELVRETEDQLRGKTDLCLKWQAASGLPVLHTDPTKLKIVLKNLLGNAIKFTDEGVVTLTVSPQGNGIEFCVSDTGIGIAPEVMPHIFEMFRQGDASTTRRHGGVGLGLYVVRQLLELLGGRIAVESKAGRGSTFRAWIPIGQQEKNQAAV